MDATTCSSAILTVPSEPSHIGSLRLAPPAAEPANPWSPVDLGLLLAEGYEHEQPTLGFRTDGVPLLYPGRLHAINGESESGKSWLAQMFVAQEVLAGRHVIYLDYEDTASGVAGRLIKLGLPPEDIATYVHYVHPETRFDTTALARLAPLLPESSLLVLDGVTELLALQGLSSNEDTAVARMWSQLRTDCAQHGPAVLLLDHVVKSSENRGRWAIGSQHKMSGLDGAAFMLERVSPFSAGRPGRARLYVTKDRHGQVRPHSVDRKGQDWIGDLVVRGGDHEVRASLDPPVTAEAAEHAVFEDFRHRVCQVLHDAAEPMSKAEVERLVKGRAESVRAAVKALVADGTITSVPRAGQHLLSLVLAEPSP